MKRLLEGGDQLPEILTPLPGPISKSLGQDLARLEAPGINTLYRGEPNIVWQEALGANVRDVDGNRYIDLTSGFGVSAIGHRHPAVVAAMAQQSQQLLHGLGDVAAHRPRIELAAKLHELSPIPDTQTYFAISGADAVEIAIKTALLHSAGMRQKLLCFEPAYHGLTTGALSLTSRPEFRAPFESSLNPRVATAAFAAEPRELENILASRQFAAVVVEPIVGREGILIPPDGWLSHLAEICRDTGTLLVADEIFTGFGRTGYCFAADSEQVVPDLTCCGKALAGGMPVGAVLGSASLMQVWASSGEARHTATFVAQPTVCAAALATLKVLETEGLIERAKSLGSCVGGRLSTWVDRFEPVQQVRGRGLLWGVELSSGHAAASWVESARQRGILMLAGGPRGRVAQIVPSLAITKTQLTTSLDLLEDALLEDTLLEDTSRP